MRIAVMAGALALSMACATRDPNQPASGPPGSAGAARATPAAAENGPQPPAQPPAAPQRPPLRLPPRSSPRPPPGPPDAAALEALGGRCPAAGCPAGTVCLEYCGVAGCRPGSVFRTCEIPCKTSAQCPQGFTCSNVSDGPGRVCEGSGRPRLPAPGGEVE